MITDPGRQYALRRLEVALRALLGRHYDVRWGPFLSGDGQSVWLPAEWLPLRVQLVQALQAAVVGAEMGIRLAGSEQGGWEEVLLNLRAETVLRRRFPGLSRTYDALRRHRAPEGESPPAQAAGPGDRFLDLILSGDAGSTSSSPELPAFRSWSVEWRQWIIGGDGRPPLPPVPPPRSRMWNQAALRGAAEGSTEDRSTPSRRMAAGNDDLDLPAADGQGLTTVLALPAAWARGLPETVGEGLASSPPSGAAVPELLQPTAWYDEWDAERGAYLPRWCAIYDRPALAPSLPTGQDGGPGPAAVRKVRRGFERYRSPNRWSRRDRDGTEVDLEAAVEAGAESGGRGFATDRIFMSRVVPHPEAAVAVLVDLSESVFGVTLQIEKEALLLLGAALEAVGDCFALYGFHGRSRLRCELLRIKDFDEPYSSAVARIGGLHPSGYTRIAPALRHLTARLRSAEARHRILLLVTDGMPFDVEGYGGTYAVEDTRRAWLEARARGVRPYCLDVDFTANQYLPRMCGPSSWTVVSEPRRLPDALLALYRRVRL
jgi:Mg-chelatase subunit ChlD